MVPAKAYIKMTCLPVHDKEFNSSSESVYKQRKRFNTLMGSEEKTYGLASISGWNVVSLEASDFRSWNILTQYANQVGTKEGQRCQSLFSETLHLSFRWFYMECWLNCLFQLFEIWGVVLILQVVSRRISLRRVDAVGFLTSFGSNLAAA